MIPIKYTYRNLFERRGVAFMTLASIGFVVLVYIGVLALAGGLRAAFADTGDPSVVIVMRDGTRAEMESSYAQESHRLLTAMPGIERTADGAVMASGETVTIQIFKRVDGTETNVMVRGVEPGAFAIRPGFEIAEGRVFEPGRGEIIVGRSLAGRLGLRVGDERKMGRNTFRVVGTFAGVGAHGSEIWGDYRDLGDSFRRSGYYSSTRLQAASPAAASNLIETVKADQRLQVQALTEPEYYELQSDTSSGQFIILGNVLAVLMAIGACFAAANTMYAQVAARAREIGTLRALGFKRRSIMGSFFLEAV
ncbi:MAG: ABC transporter permease, partial [Acidobacteriota bacterium]|nr:ABC transporter permease [Acidobacteriota bacterium]